MVSNLSSANLLSRGQVYTIFFSEILTYLGYFGNPIDQVSQSPVKAHNLHLLDSEQNLSQYFMKNLPIQEKDLWSRSKLT